MYKTLEQHCRIETPEPASVVVAVPKPAFEPGRILFISPIDEDQLALRRILHPIHLVTAAHTCRQALDRLARRHIPVVFCERELPDGTWLDMLDHLPSRPHPPLLIVTSRIADERLWAEVLNLGGFDVVATPFDPFEVRHVATTAAARTPNWELPTARAQGA